MIRGEIMKRAKRILLIVLGAVFYLMYAGFYIFTFKWEMLSGWIAFLMNVIWMALIPMIGYFLIWRARHLEDKLKDKIEEMIKKITWKKAILGVVIVAWPLYLVGSMSFKTEKKVSEFIDSPNDKNSVVVLTSDYTSEYYPAKWRLIYKGSFNSNNYVRVYSDRDVAYSWIDDDTLEFVITDKYGESETKYIRW